MTVRSAPQPTIWYGQDIMPGTNWGNALHQSLHESAIILLLVSPNFMASDSCLNIEAKRALEQHRAGQAQLIPVLLYSGDWHATPFADLEYLRRRRKPVEAWLDRDEAFSDVARYLRQEVEKCQREEASIPNVKELQQVQEERSKQL